MMQKKFLLLSLSAIFCFPCLKANIFDDISNTYNTAASAVTNAAESAAKEVAGAYNTATEAVSNTAQNAAKEVAGAYNTATNAITNTAQSAAQEVVGAYNTATGAVTSATQSAAQEVAGVYNTATGTVTSAIQGTTSTPTTTPQVSSTTAANQAQQSQGGINTSIDKIVGHTHNTQNFVIRFEQTNEALSPKTALVYNSIIKDMPISKSTTGYNEVVIDANPFPDNRNFREQFLKEYKVLIKWKDDHFYELGRFFVGSACKTILFGKIAHKQYKDKNAIKMFDEVLCDNIPAEQNIFAIDPSSNNQKYWTGWGSYWSVLENQSFSFPSGETINYNLAFELRPKKEPNSGFDQAGFYFYLLSSEGSACEDPGTGAPGIANKEGICKLTVGAECTRSTGPDGKKKRVTKDGACIGIGQACEPINGKKGIVTEFTSDHDIVCKESTEGVPPSSKSCTDTHTKAEGMLDAHNTCIPKEGASCTMPDTKTPEIIKNGTCVKANSTDSQTKTPAHSTHASSKGRAAARSGSRPNRR